ncbi:capsule biosynthesis GfcC family protein [Vibrio cholerae]|uniref:capsule biosynthesis GfcC family protein n=1 Tax=Vibrio cholerae TaxID=666 RepID=UPI0030805A1E
MLQRWVTLITLVGGLSAHSLFAAPLATTLETRFAGNATQLRFEEPIRLDQAVMQTLEHYQLSTLDVEWSSAGLFDLSHPFSFKQHVLLVLAHQQSAAPMAQKALWETLRDQLRLSAFAKRIFTPVDPDWTRLATQDNPRLNGQWLLTLNPRVAEVSVYGAVKKPGDVTWRGRQSAKDYAQAAGLVDEQISEIVVIQPDGVVQKHSVAYWNMTFAEVAPGAIVYVPMPLHDSSFYPDTPSTDANQLVIELLRNRLPL